MGFVADAIGGLFGSGKKAAESAARRQVSAAERASEQQRVAGEEALERSRAGEAAALERSRAAEERARADFQPFTAAGTRAISGLEEGLAGVSRLVTDPEAQREFITNNPFFNALAARATEDIFSNKAARGKVGSGGTAEALQNSLVLLGSNLLNQNVTQRQNVNTQFQNLVNVGQASAAGQAGVTERAAGRDVSTITGAAGRDVSTIRGIAGEQAGLSLQRGSAQAAGIIGARNAQVGALNTSISAGLAIAGLPQFNRGGGAVGDEFVPVPTRRPTQL